MRMLHVLQSSLRPLREPVELRPLRLSRLPCSRFSCILRACRRSITRASCRSAPVGASRDEAEVQSTSTGSEPSREFPFAEVALAVWAGAETRIC